MSRKLVLTTAALVAGLGIAGGALAQEDVPITGTAEQICTLPDSFISTSAFNSTTGTYGGGVWTIPESSITDTTGHGDGPPEVAIRVGGFGVCNTSHLITLTSLNGGLVNGSSTAPPPPGFSNRRAMFYQAHWQVLTTPTGGPGSSFGPRAQIISADTPNETAVANYAVSGSLAPPGSRRFDIRMAVIPDTDHMVAGVYTDTVIVSLTVQ